MQKNLQAYWPYDLGMSWAARQFHIRDPANLLQSERHQSLKAPRHLLLVGMRPRNSFLIARNRARILSAVSAALS